MKNYEGAEGLEFGGGNTKVDPSVAASQFLMFSKLETPPLTNIC
jgi:hypothetical protein